MQLEKIFELGHTIAIAFHPTRRVVRMVAQPPWPEGYYLLQEDVMEHAPLLESIDPGDLGERVDPASLKDVEWNPDEAHCWCETCSGTRRFKATSGFKTLPPTTAQGTDLEEEEDEPPPPPPPPPPPAPEPEPQPKPQVAETRSVADWSEALEDDPRNAELFAERGAAYVGMGQFERGIQDLSRALALDGSLAAAHKERANAWILRGIQEAIEDLARFRELTPEGDEREHAQQRIARLREQLHRASPQE